MKNSSVTKIVFGPADRADTLAADIRLKKRTHRIEASPRLAVSLPRSGRQRWRPERQASRVRNRIKDDARPGNKTL